MTTEQRHITNELDIKLYFHCSKCLEELPPNVTPRDWGQLEIGYTPLGIQVWCKRHDLNVVHVDFQGAKHPGNFAP